MATLAEKLLRALYSLSAVPGCAVVTLLRGLAQVSLIALRRVPSVFERDSK
jgi:hypothetical protein